MKITLKIPTALELAFLLLAMAVFSCKKEGHEQPHIAPVLAELRSQPNVDPFAGVDEIQIETILRAMTLEEKIGQLVVWTPDLHSEENQQVAADLVMNGRIGGLMPQQMAVPDYLMWTDSLRRSAAVPLLLGTSEQVLLNGQFTEGAHFPKKISIAALDSTGLKDYLENEYFRQCKALGIDFTFRSALPQPDGAHPDQIQQTQLLTHELSVCKANNILAFADNFSNEYFQPNDSARIASLLDATCFISDGQPGIFLQEGIFENNQTLAAQTLFLREYLSEKMGFRGISMARLLDGETAEMKLLQGADLFLTTDPAGFFRSVFQLLDAGSLTEKLLEDRTRQVLRAKAWVHGGRLPVQLSKMPMDSTQSSARLVSFVDRQAPKLVRPYQPRDEQFDKKAEELTAYFQSPAWHFFAKRLFQQSITCAADDSHLLPFKNLLEKDFRIVEMSGSRFQQFRQIFSKYADFKQELLSPAARGRLPVVKMATPGQHTVAVVLLDSFSISRLHDQPFIQTLNDLSREVETVVVNFGPPANLAAFEKSITFLQAYERNKWTESAAASALFGGMEVSGQLPITVSPDLPIGTSERIFKERVSFDGPEGAGIAPERLVGIDAIAESAISHRTFPGCQVALIKDGHVIYSKGFGHHTYTKEKQVTTSDLYDIASVTKIAATTLAVMKLEERNRLSVKGKVGEYAQLAPNANVRNIRIRDLLTHNSGLQPSMPIQRFYNYRNVPAGGCNDYFCRAKSDDFTIQITPSIFFRADYQDTIWHRVGRLRPERNRHYQYSDVNFFLLQKAVEDVSGIPLDKYLEEQLYHPLGLRHLLFNPTRKYDTSRIVPTEHDHLWRKSLVHGFVHDPAAALMGGVGGNAGLFSNAEDLAVLLQVLANNGVYAGIQFFEEKTIHAFTSADPGSHRGLGFDKPVSRKSPTYAPKTPRTAYGHNGFTGTCAWVDPDNDLVYVFLSNRIHPSSNNMRIFVEGVRSRIHNVVYEALGSFDQDLPVLPEIDD